MRSKVETVAINRVHISLFQQIKQFMHLLTEEDQIFINKMMLKKPGEIITKNQNRYINIIHKKVSETL